MAPIRNEPVSNDQAIEDTIIQLAISILRRKPGDLKPDQPLLSSQEGFDSFSLMEFVLSLEKQFGISIPDEDLDPDVFQSIGTIANYVRARMQSNG